jgi:hypothetical protein
MFNAMLRSDVSFHDKHYSFDSNLDLSLYMFSSRTGRLNNRGMSNIIRHLGSFIASNVQANQVESKLELSAQGGKRKQKKISEYFKVNTPLIQCSTKTDKPNKEETNMFFRPLNK